MFKNKILLIILISFNVSLIASFVLLDKQVETELNLGAPTNFVVTSSSTTMILSSGTATSTFAPASTTIAGNISIIGRTTFYGGQNSSSTATSTMANGIQLYNGCFRDIGGSCISGGLSAAVTSLNGLTESTQTFSSPNGLLVISSSGTTHTFNASTSPYFVQNLMRSYKKLQKYKKRNVYDHETNKTFSGQILQT